MVRTNKIKIELIILIPILFFQCVQGINETESTKIIDSINIKHPNNDILSGDKNSNFIHQPDTIDIKNEINKFWKEFVFYVNNGDSALINCIKFPISIECLIEDNKIKHKYEKTDYHVIKKELINKKFFQNAASFNLYKNSKSLWDAQLYEYGSILIFEYGHRDIGTESGIHYKFKKFGDNWKLIEIYCVG